MHGSYLVPAIAGNPKKEGQKNNEDVGRKEYNGPVMPETVNSLSANDCRWHH